MRSTSPNADTSTYLEYVTVKDGKVASRKTLAQTSKDGKSLTPGYARFHIGSGEKMYIVTSGSMNDDAGKSFSDNFLAAVPTGDDKPVFTRLNMKYPLSTFFTNTPRGGSKPGDVLDLHGIGADGGNLRYARIHLK